MADYLANLEEVYNKLYNSKQAALNNDKSQKFAGLDSQQQALINQYQELQNSLSSKKQGVEAQYKNLYSGLDTQQQQGKEQYYNDRNSAALSNAQKSQQIRDYMARNNLLSSGENVDAMLRSNTDYNNNLGNIYNSENQFNRGIADKRSQYSLAEQGAYTDINNQLGAADREKTQKLSDISNQRNLLENNYLNELQSYRDQLNAQKVKDINDYNERLRQENVQRQEAEKQRQWQAQQAARSTASRNSAAQDKANKEAELNGAYSALYQNMDRGYGQDFLRQNRDGIISTFGAKVYEDMADKVARNIPRDAIMTHAREFNMRPQNE